MNPLSEHGQRRLLGVGAGLLAGALVVTAVSWRAMAASDSTVAIAAPRASVGATGANGETRKDSYSDVVKLVAPSVVTIRAEGHAAAARTGMQAPDDDLLRRFFGEHGFGIPGLPNAPQMPFNAPALHALGSGVVVSADGYVLTNHHVVAHADEVRVETDDGRTLPAKIVGNDAPSDLALLKVDASDLHPIAMGDSDRVEVGDVVLAVGNPLGIGETVTMGIISAKGRSTTTGVRSASYEDFLQTDAPINHGNSGGALVNTHGELIGINSQILSETGGNIGIGFAIPSNMARRVADDLRTKGKVTRARLGVGVQGMTSELAASLGMKEVNGVLVDSVAPGSAADRAGLKRGDVIESLDGQPVRDTNALRNRVANRAPGTKAAVSFLRDGHEKTIDVTLDEASADATAQAASEEGRGEPNGLGVAVAPLTQELAEQFGIPATAHGLVVEQVEPDGRAAAAGLQPGDVIEEANRKPVKTIEELRTAVRATTDRPLLLLIDRQGTELFVPVRQAAR